MTYRVSTWYGHDEAAPKDAIVVDGWRLVASQLSRAEKRKLVASLQRYSWSDDTILVEREPQGLLFY